MRKLTYGAAVSLDGFIAGPDGTLDWLRWSDDAAAISAESWKGVDTILMGRKTYEFAVRSGGGGGGEGDGGIRSIVFSRTMAEAPDGAELVRADGDAFVRALKAGEGRDIILMGGGELAASLIAAGLVDEIGLNVHPVLLGAGVPMFPPGAPRTALDLVESRAIARGCLFLRYRAAAAG